MRTILQNDKNRESANQTQRQLRVGELLRHNIANLLLRGDIHDQYLNKSSVTVSQVTVSADMKWAKAFIVPLGGRNTDNILKSLNKHAYLIQGSVASNLRMRRMPKIKFIEDTSFEYAKTINDKFQSISKSEDK